MIAVARETDLRAANVAVNLSRFQRWAKGIAEAVLVPRRLEVTVQTERILIIRRQRLRRVWCQHCRREVDAISPQEAASLAGGERHALSGNIGSDDWHFCEGANGEPLVCLESLD